MVVTIRPRNRRGSKPLGSEVSWEDEDTKVIPAETMAQIRQADEEDTAVTQRVPTMARVRTRPMGSKQHRVCLTVNGGTEYGR